MFGANLSTSGIANRIQIAVRAIGLIAAVHGAIRGDAAEEIGSITVHVVRVHSAAYI